MDPDKACDRVQREELWFCMRESGVTEKYVRPVQDMYDSVVEVTADFKAEVGPH